MTKVGVVYWSGTGSTQQLAEAVAEGVHAQSGVKVELVRVESADVIEGRYEKEETYAALDTCDAIIFGTPTHMGSVSAPTKAFLDGALKRWYARQWSGKVAAGFTVSSTPSGDKLNAMMDLMIYALQHGMVWVGLDESPLNAEGVNRLGFYAGAAAQPDYAAKEPALMAGDLETGRRLGARVASFADALRRGQAQ